MKNFLKNFKLVFLGMLNFASAALIIFIWGWLYNHQVVSKEILVAGIVLYLVLLISIYHIRIWFKSLSNGTKTLLIGIHNPIWHSYYLIKAWRILYRSWPEFHELIAILLHDLGLWGMKFIDDAEGERHPEIIAVKWMNFCNAKKAKYSLNHNKRKKFLYWDDLSYKVYKLIIGHSRFYAKKAGLPISKLCAADKLASALYPVWFYLKIGRWSGEIAEYKREYRSGKYTQEQNMVLLDTDLIWFLQVRATLTKIAFDMVKESAFIADKITTEDEISKSVVIDISSNELLKAMQRFGNTIGNIAISFSKNQPGEANDNPTK